MGGVLHPQSTRERKGGASRRAGRVGSVPCGGSFDGISGKSGRVETTMQPRIDLGLAYCYSQAVLAVVRWVGLETVGLQAWSFCNKVIVLETISDSEDASWMPLTFWAGEARRRSSLRCVSWSEM